MHPLEGQCSLIPSELNSFIASRRSYLKPMTQTKTKDPSNIQASDKIHRFVHIQNQTCDAFSLHAAGVNPFPTFPAMIRQRSFSYSCIARCSRCTYIQSVSQNKRNRLKRKIWTNHFIRPNNVLRLQLGTISNLQRPARPSRKEISNLLPGEILILLQFNQ